MFVFVTATRSSTQLSSQNIPSTWHQRSRALMINYKYIRKDKQPVAIVETRTCISFIIKIVLSPVYPRCVDLCYQHLLWITWSYYFHSTAPIGVYENNYTLYNFDCTERKIVIWNAIWTAIFLFHLPLIWQLILLKYYHQYAIHKLKFITVITGT